MERFVSQSGGWVCFGAVADVGNGGKYRRVIKDDRVPSAIPSPATGTFRRRMNDQRWQKKMSLDFQQQPPLYQQDVDFIQDPPPPHHHFDQQDPMDAADHPAYMFNDPRYRTNASSSSSLNHSFDGLYHPPFGESVPSFNSGNYDIITNLSSGKVSPLTPSDSVTSLHHPPGFPPKDYNHQAFPDMESRRLPGVNPAYHSDYPDDYAIGGINNGIPFSPSAMNHFHDRLGRFPPDRYSHPNGPPSGMRAFVSNPRFAHFIRGVAPQATHSFRDHSVYDDMHYLGNVHPEMRNMHAVDETLSRMRLNPLAGASSDLQTFIRSVSLPVISHHRPYKCSSPFLDQYVRTPNRLAFGERTVIVMSSKVAQKSYGTEKRFASFCTPILYPLIAPLVSCALPQPR